MKLVKFATKRRRDIRKRCSTQSLYISSYPTVLSDNPDWKNVGSTRYCTNRRSAVRIRINFWRMVGQLYLLWRLGQCTWVLKVSDSPSLKLVIPGIAVSPGLTHSDSRIVFVTGTVVKPQQPTLSDRKRPQRHDTLTPHYTLAPKFGCYSYPIPTGG